jgi:hypothetical protein
LVVNGASYDGNESVETLGLFDVNTPAALLNHNTGLNPAIFADLGTGTTYGTFLVGRYRSDSTLRFELNAAALGNLVSNTGPFFSIGGTLLSASRPVITDSIFGASGQFPASLVIDTELLASSPTPEPTSWLLIGTGLLGVIARRRTARV